MKDPSTKPIGKSRYQKKVARKHGRGTVGANWQWWMDSGDKPRAGAHPIFHGPWKPAPDWTPYGTRQ